MNTQTLQLPLLLPSGPDCERCLTLLQSDLAQIKGVSTTAINAKQATLNVGYDPDLVTPSRIEERARQIGAELTATIDHQSIELRDLDCPDCASSIEKDVRKTPGVVWAGANFAAARLLVEFERSQTDLPTLCRVAERHGVRAIRPDAADGVPTSPASTNSAAEWLRDNRRALSLAAVAVLMAAAWALRGPATIPLLALAIALGGWTTLRAAAMALRARALDMNVLMTLAVIGAAAIGDWFEAGSVVALFSLGNLLQAGALERTRRSIRSLIALTPKTARVRRGESVVDVPVQFIEIGDVVLVRPGERLAVDGVVVAGASAVNQAPITGESMPVEKAEGASVYAGSLNGNGALEIRAARAYRDTTLARIIQSVEAAQAQRAPVQLMIDRFATFYTPAVVSLAALVAVGPPAAAALAHATGAGDWSRWFLRALALLIIACPCALVISTPVAIVTAIGSAARRGVLIKGGAYLEALDRLRTLVFDKTGTLTTGRFRIETVLPIAGGEPSRLLAIAAAIESRSEHPLAAAFVRASHEASGHLHLTVAEFTAHPGMGAEATVESVRYVIGSTRLMAARGVLSDDARRAAAEHEAAGRTVVALADSSRLLALFALEDGARPEVRRTVEALRRAGIEHVGILTGDSAAVAQAVAEPAGVSDWKAGLLPEDKLEAVRDYRQKCGPVAMVGDGVNDAPALAAADVGIVMGAAGSDVAIETADVALMSDELSRLPWLIGLGRRSRAIIRQNIAFSLVTKLALVCAAVSVGLPLWLAVAGDVGVSLLVTANALRLRAA